MQRLQGVPVQLLEPGVPYVRAKYLYFRGKFADAAAGFGSIASSNGYYFQARYFLGTVMVKTGDLAGASVVFDSILKLQPPDDSAKEIQDLARLALGRILYERSQFDRAVEAYQAVGKQSAYFPTPFTSNPGPTSRPRNGKRPIERWTCCCSPAPTTRKAPS